jgi:hypothetical protein
MCHYRLPEMVAALARAEHPVDDVARPRTEDDSVSAAGGALTLRDGAAPALELRGAEPAR